MNSQKNQNLERRLKELEVEINSSSPPISVSENKSTKLLDNSSNSQHLEGWFRAIQSWFNNLPTPGRVAVLVVAFIFGLSLLNTVLQIVTSLISLAILGFVLYFLYKFFSTPRS